MNTDAGGIGRVVRSLLVAMVVVCALAGIVASSALAGVVPTNRGPVRGLETPKVKEYLGIPYAAPPVGGLRWRPPHAPARWRTPLDATRFANHCPQVESPFGFPSTSEDCLYLNVFTPNNGPGRGHTKDLPVMVWLHGGGFTVGESDDYDPTRLVQRGVIVVTVNYRLGYLGFLAHPALSAESSYHGSGDYGLMDQQAGLHWVERNITKFGGDAQNVTIFGQSAGGLSVHAQLASPLAAGLFDHAIGQSGAYALRQPSLSSAEAQGRTIATNAGCSDQTAACLRSVPVSTLLALQPTIEGALGPNVDGHVLPQSVGAAFQSGQFNRVPVIEGSTHDEFSVFTQLAVAPLFENGVIPNFAYGLIVSVLLPTVGLSANPADVLVEYPLTDYPSAAEAITAIGTDAIFACPGRRAAQSFSQYVPTYAYEFNDRNAPQPFLPPAPFPYGAFHASELASLFDSPLRGGHAPFDADQEALAADMVRYWTQFASAGTPNGSGAPQWPAYTTANDTYQSLVPPTPKPETGFAEDHKCGFWDSH